MTKQTVVQILIYRYENLQDPFMLKYFSHYTKIHYLNDNLLTLDFKKYHKLII